MPHFFLTLLVCLFSFFFQMPSTIAASTTTQEGYVRHSDISLKTWNELVPYFLPVNHPVKKKLDALFKTRITLNEQTLGDAGFKSPQQRPYSKIVASKHPKLKGYLVKLYPDSCSEPHEWVKLVNRIKGAQAIKECITKHQYEDLIKVPNKWLYPLPIDPAPPAGYYPKHFILVVEDMYTLKNKENYKCWKSKMMTPDRVQAIYTIIKEVGLYDCIYAFNIQFSSKDGKLAFIDTEHHHGWPVDYLKLLPYFSPEMQGYFQMLVQSEL